MISLTQYISEALDKPTLNKLSNNRLNGKKEELLAIKKGLSEYADDELSGLADGICTSLSNYARETDMADAIKNNKVDGWKTLYEKVKAANKNKEVDERRIIDVLQIISSGKNLDAAIAEIAKKL